MIKEEKKYYVCRHLRADNHEPFYVGMGSSKKYKRDREKKGRNTITGEIFKCVRMAAEPLNINKHDLARMLRGEVKNKTCLIFLITEDNE